jgi:hypothetical protein
MIEEFQRNIIFPQKLSSSMRNKKKAIEFMKNQLRNVLEHYIPCSWSLEIHVLPEMVDSYFGIIEFLAVESGNVRWQDNDMVRIKALCDSGKKLPLSTKIHREISEQIL